MAAHDPYSDISSVQSASSNESAAKVCCSEGTNTSSPSAIATETAATDIIPYVTPEPKIEPDDDFQPSDSIAAINGNEILCPSPISQVPLKRCRGRPLGSANKRPKVPKMLWDDLDDLSAWIASFIKETCRAVSILSAVGEISVVALRDVASGNVQFYEGDWDIVSLTGVCLPHGIGEMSYAGGVSIYLQSPTGEILAGQVCGSLVAGAMVRVVSLSFSIDHHLKGKKKSRTYPSTASTAQDS
ncbi:PPC domain [Dillenia turbinata]|uniref:AT-hook motif nuclear-localized protein n=1 Tax=Dillenia turbinata TaxID=194707 RepID=A0AAN8U930_9MAGN